MLNLGINRKRPYKQELALNSLQSGRKTTNQIAKAIKSNGSDTLRILRALQKEKVIECWECGQIKIWFKPTQYI